MRLFSNILSFFLKSDVIMPDYMAKLQKTENKPLRRELPISLDDVRLVVTIDDEVTGRQKDVIAEHIHGGPPFLHREWGSPIPRHTRYISGLDIEIPWPHTPHDEAEDQDVDTLRVEVETPSWIPSLLNHPFPPSVMDELRNKFSKYRTRHDQKWVAEKEREDLFNEYLASRTLLTPKGEKAELERAKRREAKKAKLDANGNWKMEPDTAKFIDQFMRNSNVKGNV